MTELFTIRDARKEDMFLVDLYAKAEGMDRIPGILPSAG